MKIHVLGVDGNTRRSINRRRHLTEAGFVVLHAFDEAAGSGSPQVASDRRRLR